MAAYLPGSDVQVDTMHTLYLMNPTYAGYTEASNSGNMDLVGPSKGIGQNNPLPTNGFQQQQQQQQQHYIGFPFPAFAQNSVAQDSPMIAISGSTIEQHNPSSAFYNGNVYDNNWNSGNESSFVPSNDVTQSLAAHLTSGVNPGQQLTSELPRYRLKGQSASFLNEQLAPLHHSALNVENTETSAVSFQGLSLSLCPQQPIIQMQPLHTQSVELGMGAFLPLLHGTASVKTDRSERLPNKWVGSSSSFRASSSDGVHGVGYLNSLSGQNKHLQLDSNSTIEGGSGVFLGYSKYLKAAQQLLDEIVSFERGMNESAIRHPNLQSWVGHNAFTHGRFVKDSVLPNASGSCGATSISGGPSSVFLPKQSNENVPELKPSERQELQTMKAKLMVMLDEVERRYNMYYNQMQIVMMSFESVSGIGSAKKYTALALQTISRHFRSVKDAINGQIRVTSKALGEDYLSSQGRGKGPRLQFANHQLLQQRALQQFGTMQQNVWRPQRGLPEHSVSILRAWLFEHFLRPYPKDSDKMMLAKQTGLTRNQVSNWFINARVRLWKPMVEEMYLEEMREAGTGAAESRVRDDTESVKGTDMIENSGNSECHKQKQVNDESEFWQQGNSLDHESPMPQTRTDPPNGRGPTNNLLIYQNDTRGGLKKPRKENHDFVPMLPANTSVEIKSEESQSDGGFQRENRLGKLDRHSGESYILSHNGIAQPPEVLTGFGTYVEGLHTRYACEGIATKYPANSGISLTLGLQHYDGLSLSGRHYIHDNFLHTSGKRQDCHKASAEDCYNVGDSLSNQNSYEAIKLQDRRGFATRVASS